MVSVMTVGELLKRLREEAGLTQLELETQGGPKQSVTSRIERGEISDPTEDTLRQAATGLRMEFEDLRQMIDRLQSAEPTPKALTLGFLHGIHSAPIIAMLMEGDLYDIKAASKEEEQSGLLWWEAGVKPSKNQLDKAKSAAPLFAGSLQRAFRNLNLDLIVASCEIFEPQLRAGNSLFRCAQISTSYVPFQIMDIYPKDQEMAESRVVPDLKKRNDGKPIKLLYPSGTIGQKYRDLLASGELATYLDPQYFELKEGSGSLPAAIEGCLNEGVHFRVLLWSPIFSGYTRKLEEKGWKVKLYNINQVLDEYSLPIPEYSVDLLLNGASPSVVEWLRSKEYSRFTDRLMECSFSLSSKELKPDSPVVAEIAEYLDGMDRGECYTELRRFSFNILFYGDFLDFLDKVRKRII